MLYLNFQAVIHVRGQRLQTKKAQKMTSQTHELCRVDSTLTPIRNLLCADVSSSDQCNGHDHEKVKPGNRLLTAMSDEGSTSGPETSTYGCPVCRKEHLLDLDKLQAGLLTHDRIDASQQEH